MIIRADGPTLGILQTDVVTEPLRSRHGDYPAMFRSLLLQGRSPAAARTLAFRVYDVRAGAYPAALEECGAYLITGSSHSVYEAAGWIRELERFVRELHACRHKLVGICFGHQIVARALGGPGAAGEAGWTVGAQPAVVRQSPPWMQPRQRRITLLSSHRDQVFELPPGAEWLIDGEASPYAGFALGDHVITFQGHPEFTVAYMQGLLDLRREALGEALWRAGYESLASRTDQTLVARWLFNFLHWRRESRP